MSQKPYPCLVCGKALESVGGPNGMQPSGGIMCLAMGNYGSTQLDDLLSEPVEFNVCDECFVWQSARIGPVKPRRCA